MGPTNQNYQNWQRCREVLENDMLAAYFDFEWIIVKDAVEIDKDGKPFDVLEGKLFSEQATKHLQ